MKTALGKWVMLATLVGVAMTIWAIALRNEPNNPLRFVRDIVEIKPKAEQCKEKVELPSSKY